MKNSIRCALAVILSWGVCSFGEELEIPAIVEAAFAKRYVGITARKWEFDKNGNWEAKFTKDEKKFRADFSPSGKWIETESSFEFGELPEAIQKAVRASYPGKKVNEIEWVEIPDVGVFYDVEFKRKGKNLDIRYKEDGTTVPKE